MRAIKTVLAVALASSDDVKVYSEGFVDPADGIDAKSSAVAVAVVDQDATQSNSSTQSQHAEQLW